MLKLLTKFKTQSLNEVRPYESNGEVVSSSHGEKNGDDGTLQKTWHSEETVETDMNNYMGSTPKDSCIFTSFHTCISNVNIRTLNVFNEALKEDELVKNENKENGEHLYFPGTSNSRDSGMILTNSAEKRKRSHLSNNSMSNDSSSSDEEVKELLSKQPKNECRKGIDEDLVTNVSTPLRNTKIRPTESHARKRHRFAGGQERFYSRPSLDFEKMQQKVYYKRSSTNGAGRPRIVKVRSFAGLSPNLGSSVMTFQPIQGIQAFKLPPVEETRSIAF